MRWNRWRKNPSGASASDGASLVSFAPTTAGPKSATLQILNDDSDEGTSGVSLVGTGVVPDLAVTPAARSASPAEWMPALTLALLLLLLIWLRHDAERGVHEPVREHHPVIRWIEGTAAAHTEIGAPLRVSRGIVLLAWVLFFLLLAGLPLLTYFTESHAIALFDSFYRTGSLVFGGGHVVLPLLRNEVVPPGWVSDDVFLAG